MVGQQARLIDNVVDAVISTNIDQNIHNNKTLFISSATAFLSSSQLNAIVNVANHFHRPQITITSNLNFAVSGVLNHKNKNLQHILFKNGLSVSYEDVVNPVFLSNAEIKKNRKYDDISIADGVIATTLLAGKLSQKKLRGLAALIQLENLSGVNILSPTEFLFEFNTPGRIDVLRHGLDDLGFATK